MKNPSIASIIILVCFYGLFFLQACSKEHQDSAQVAQEMNVKNLGTTDDEKNAQFIVKAVEGDFASIKLAQLALSQSSDPEVKRLAEILERDHIKALNELRDFAYKKGIAIPAEESSDAKTKISDLEKGAPGEFNKAWVEEFIDDHEHTIKLFESAWDETNDVELKSWINHKIPGLRTRLDELTAYDRIMTSGL
ncbi:MAG TPA: DUF4142 domain-containing protein [Cyclobacteriaceae bacterium]|jgi:putative membrane protein|nr:DUF4142 domain-containing protein [Cyclobacteriaceae bacterium]